MAVASCCRCTAVVAAAVVVAVVATGCCAPVAGRNRTPSLDEAGNDAVAVDGVAGAVGVVAGVAAVDDDDEGGGAVVVVAGVGGGVQRWSPSPNFDNQLLRHRMPHRLQKASRQLLDVVVVVGVDGVAGPQPTNRNRAPFLPFQSASGRPTSCTLLKKITKKCFEFCYVFIF